MTRVSSHQPSFLPWTGFWAKVLDSEVHVVSAGVGFDYGGYQNRSELQGNWLTIPVSKEARQRRIADVLIADGFNVAKMARTIQGNLPRKNSPFVDRLEPVLRTLEGFRGRSLTHLNTSLLHDVLDILGHPCAVVLDTRSDLAETKTERLVSRIERNVRGDVKYLAGGGARSYLETDRLPANWSVQFQQQVLKEPTSVLHLIAREPDPAKAIRAQFGWSQSYEADRRPIAPLG